MVHCLLGYAPLIREYVFYLESKLNFHRNHPEFNGMFSAVPFIECRAVC